MCVRVFGAQAKRWFIQPWGGALLFVSLLFSPSTTYLYLPHPCGKSALLVVSLLFSPPTTSSFLIPVGRVHFCLFRCCSHHPPPLPSSSLCGATNTRRWSQSDGRRSRGTASRFRPRRGRCGTTVSGPRVPRKNRSTARRPAALAEAVTRPRTASN